MIVSGGATVTARFLCVLMYHQSQMSRESSGHEALTYKGMHSRRMLCRMQTNIALFLWYHSCS